MANKITRLLFGIYLTALVWILLLKLGVQFSYMGSRSVNLIPFREALLANGKIDYAELILNVVIFVPLGIYEGVLFNRWTWRNKVGFIFLTSFLIEAVQYILRVGAFDITDLITNISGGVIGLIIYAAVEKIFNNSEKSQRFINIVAALATILIVSLLVLLKLNMLPIRYQ